MHYLYLFLKLQSRTKKKESSFNINGNQTDCTLGLEILILEVKNVLPFSITLSVCDETNRFLFTFGGLLEIEVQIWGLGGK